MSFFHPERLWLLLLVVALCAFYLYRQRTRKSYALRFTNLELLAEVAPARPGWRRHVPAALFLSMLAVLIVAFADPASEQRVERERATIVMAIDTSLSMLATDVEPSRIDAAKTAAKTFVDGVPPKINIGLVGFNGAATVWVPPTTDRLQVKNAIDRLQLDERTAIGEAIFASLEALRLAPQATDTNDERVPGAIVLMSDGQTTAGRPNVLAIEAARTAEVPVATIAFGTPGGMIRLPETQELVEVPVQPDELREIAAGTDGDFFTAESAEELQQVYADIGSSEGFEVKLSSIADWFVGAAVLLALLTALLSLAWFSRLP